MHLTSRPMQSGAGLVLTVEEEANKTRTLTTLLFHLKPHLGKSTKGPEDAVLTAATHIAILLSRGTVPKDGKAEIGPIIRSIAVTSARQIEDVELVVVTENPKREQDASRAEVTVCRLTPSDNTLLKLSER